MDDLQRLQEELAVKWLEKNGEQALERAVVNLRNGLAGVRVLREKALRWAWAMRHHLDRARREIGHHASTQKLCDWLNDSYKVGKPIRSSRGGRFYRATFLTDLYGVADRYAEDLVLECRTRMTARAMSADFKQRGHDRNALEAEAIDNLVPVIGLVYRLQALPIPPRAVRREEARLLMIDVAKQQRQSQYAPMLARAAFLTEDEFDIMAPAFRDDAGFWKLVERMRAAQ